MGGGGLLTNVNRNVKPVGPYYNSSKMVGQRFSDAIKSLKLCLSNFLYKQATVYGPELASVKPVFSWQGTVLQRLPE